MSSLGDKTCFGNPMAALFVFIFISAFSPIAQSQDLGLPSAPPSSSSSPSPSPPSGENPFLKLMRPPRKPIPLRWKIVIVLTALAIGSGSLWCAVRVWRKWNLFDREYHFPRPTTAALRFGAVRSGGHMATITFRDRAGPSATDALGGKNR